jgi:uncharacterized protein (DUF983 family)
MDNEILIIALSAIANASGGKVDLNAKACKLLAKRALEHYTAQRGVREDECPHCESGVFTNAFGTSSQKCNICNGTGTKIGENYD